MRRHRAALAGLLLIAAAAPGFVAALRQPATLAVELARVPYAQRRARVNGAVWTSAQEVAQRFPSSQPVPMILNAIHDVDIVVFVNDYLYPRVVRTFLGLEDYRVRGIDPGGRRPVVHVDMKHSAGARIMSYAAIRHEQIEDEPPVATTVTAPPILTGIVPFAVAFDGAPPDTYMTTLVIAADRDATVTMTLEPSQKTMRFRLHAGETRVFRDAVYECFDEFGSGWIGLSSTEPIRAAAWLVNRGRHRAVAVPLITSLPPLPRQVAGGDHLFLLNAGDATSSVTVNGTNVVVPPHALASVGAASHYAIVGDAPLLAFSARKLPDGNTSFTWP